MNQLPSEISAVCAVLTPQNKTAGAQTSAYMDMSKFSRGLATIMAGVLGSSATLDAKLVQATDSSGTGVKDITGKAITQFVKASNDGSVAEINVEQTDLDMNNNFRFVAIVMTVGTATSYCAALLQGFAAANEPASDNDSAAVVEIIK
jgi:hypothetical protein